MFFRTKARNIGWEYTGSPEVAESWQDNSRGYFAEVETVSDTLAEALAEALVTAEALGYFFYEGVAEKLFNVESEEDISRIMCNCRHAKQAENESRKYGSPYYENCRLANHIYHPISKAVFPAWMWVTADFDTYLS